jgi:SET domain-containing protein
MIKKYTQFCLVLHTIKLYTPELKNTDEKMKNMTHHFISRLFLLLIITGHGVFNAIFTI